MNAARACRLASALLAGVPCAMPLAAQGAWDAILVIDPAPSPYLSDWEANNSIATLTVVSGSAEAQSVRLVFSVTNGSQQAIASGASAPQVIPGGASAIFDSPVKMAGSTRHDAALESQMRRTGRLPEGDYRICIAVVDPSGFELAQACESFSLVYPDPPRLVAPFDGETLATDDLIFQWTPSQVPLNVAVRYVLLVAEIRTGQLPAEALRSSAVHYTNADAGVGHLQYPLEAPRFRPGATYAWKVQALDVNGYAVSANAGSSEIWSFRFEDGTDAAPRSTPGGGAPSRMKLIFSSEEPEDGLLKFSGALGPLCATLEERAAGAVSDELRLGYAGPALANDELDVLVHFSSVPVGMRTSKRWVIHGLSTTTKFEYLARGDCDGPKAESGLVRLHYIARRKSAQSFKEFLDAAFATSKGGEAPGEPAQPEVGAHEGFEMDFGTAIIGLRSTTMSGEDALDVEREFFKNNEIEVKPGLNLFGIIWMPEGGIWDWLKDFGFDQNKWEVQGFVGFATTASIGLGYESGGDGGEGNVSLQSEFLKLQLAFPERTPKLMTWVKKMRGGIEFTINDSLAGGVSRNEGSGITFHAVTMLTWTWEINDTVSIIWKGGIDLNAGKNLGEDVEKKVELVLNGSVDGHLAIPVGPTSIWIGNPLLELHYDLKSKEEFILLGAFETGIGEAPPLKWGGSVTFKGHEWKEFGTTKPLHPELLAAKDRLEATEGMVNTALLAQREAVATATKRDADGFPVIEPQVRRAVFDATKVREEARAKYLELLEKHPPAERPKTKKSGIDWHSPTWRVGVSAGNVSIGELLDFFRTLW